MGSLDAFPDELEAKAARGCKYSTVGLIGNLGMVELLYMGSNT